MQKKNTKFQKAGDRANERKYGYLIVTKCSRKGRTPDCKISTQVFSFVFHQIIF